jgi:hypothetical protein
MVLVSGYHMEIGAPNWEIVFGRIGRHVRVFDLAARRDDHGMTAAPETCAVPGTAFERLARWGGDRLSAANVMRKGIQ